ncbi:hypothetical protein [Bradyrhizobium oligotrophicum]|uniref:hypothetical protein n=1 Tax=Bradyrhizobium oligotrophicum TaxID=44255 RepID=UPI003EBEB98B
MKSIDVVGQQRTTSEIGFAKGAAKQGYLSRGGGYRITRRKKAVSISFKNPAYGHTNVLDPMDPQQV